MPAATFDAVRLRRGGLNVRTVFVATLLFIAVGLTYMITIGLLQR